MKISEMNEAQRPRERMLAEGVKVLNDAELLAVLLRTGTGGGESALDLSHRLLGLSDGSLLKLSTLPVKDLCVIPGVKENKALTVLAAFELGRRFCEEEARTMKDPITSPLQAYRILIPQMKGLDHEVCKIIYLDRGQYFIAMETLTTGGTGSTTFDVPYIVRKALERNAGYVIIAHNHPNGNPRPSKADIAMTKSIRDALSVMGVGLVDHIIVSDDRFYSFADDRIGKAKE
ncbi:MAG: DNA repair protein RadC [Bacteroidales bacterium]|nr:DNA repair protein RadC [Bacteroidales bacterium]